VSVYREATEFFRPEARRLPPYNSGASVEDVKKKYGVTCVTKLGSNENRFGSNPNVIAALKAAAEASAVYPDPNCSELCDHIASATDIASDRVIFGNGSEALIEALCHAALSPGDRVVTVAPSFGLHEIFPIAMGATVDKVAMSASFDFNVTKLREAVSRPTKMLLFSNPSNPVGCCLDEEGFRQLIAACAPNTLLVIDEAYIEYVDSPRYPNSLRILSEQHRPWLVLRTLSKAYGLAGLRVGYAIASDPEIVTLLKRVRSPFSVNSAAQAAAAVALKDREYLQRVTCETRRRRRALFERLAYFAEAIAPQVKVIPSQANFLFIDTGAPSTLVADRLMAQGVITKPWLEEGFRTALRVTIGTDDDNEHFIDAFRTVMTGLATPDACRRKRQP
jgi:histidinol-phosphate aminotransferase